MVLIAVTAVYRSVVSGLEGNLGNGAAIRTYCFMHFPLSAGASVVHSLLAGIAAVFAAAGFIFETLLRVKLLLTCGENELVPTLFASHCFVLKCH